MERRLYLWTNASPKEWKRAKYTYRAMSPLGKLSPIVGGEILEANQTVATLEALATCLREFSGRQKQTVCVVCSCPAVITSINQHFPEKWEGSGYVNSKGEPVKHADLWKTIVGLSREKQMELTSRAPDDTETEIMHEMGAMYLNPRIPVTAT